MEFFVIQTLIGLSYGLLLFMLSSGLTLIFSMMGVLNFAHASFYMLGAYVAYQIMNWVGYWPALVVAPLVVGGMGSLAGAFIASLLIGLLQTFAVSLDWSVASGLSNFGLIVPDSNYAYPLLTLTLAQVAPVLPYLLLVLVLIFRPRGLMGTREG